MKGVPGVTVAWPPLGFIEAFQGAARDACLMPGATNPILPRFILDPDRINKHYMTTRKVPNNATCRNILTECEVRARPSRISGRAT